MAAESELNAIVSRFLERFMNLTGQLGGKNGGRAAKQMRFHLHAEPGFAEMLRGAGAGTEGLGVNTEHFIALNIFEKNSPDQGNEALDIKQIRNTKERVFR